MRLPRMTTRRWMIAVAVIGVGLAVLVQLGRRRAEYLRLAAYHGRLGRWGGSIFGGGTVIRFDPDTRRSTMTSLTKIEHHARLAEKYELAARYPWLPVEPDPPEPR